MSEFTSPIPGGFTITSPYAAVRPSGPHGGVDIVPSNSPANGSPAWANANSFVERTGSDSTRGNYVVLDNGKGVQTTYMHLSSIDVTAGQELKQGEVVGKIGSTGHSTGPHLHLAMTKDGNRIDPTPSLYGILKKPAPSSSSKVEGNISVPEKPDVVAKNSTRALDVDDTDEGSEDWSRPRDIHESYFASAELVIDDRVICPFEVQPPKDIGTDDETQGIDLSLMEFQFRPSVSKGGSIAMFTLFLKSWSDVADIMAVCAEAQTAQYRYGYLNIPNSLNGPFYGEIVSVTPTFRQNGYELRIELIDKAIADQVQAGAKTQGWRALSGRVSDIAHQLAEDNDWLICIEPSLAINPENNLYVQKNQTDFAFISEVLAPAATSSVKRPNIAGDGTGYGPYHAWLKWSPKHKKTVLHFHPLHNAPSNPQKKSKRLYVWGGVQDGSKHEMGTVISFVPVYDSRAYTLMGGANYKGNALDIWTKQMRSVIVKGTNVTDAVLSGGAGVTESKLSNQLNTQRQIFPYRDPDLLLTSTSARYFHFRDWSFSASMVVLGDPFLTSGIYCSVKVVRPNSGVLMFYDWIIFETIHTIVNGEFTTSMELVRYQDQPTGYVRQEDIDDLGMGAGLVAESSAIEKTTVGLSVGKNWEK